MYCQSDCGEHKLQMSKVLSYCMLCVVINADSEESSLVDMFIFDILITYVESLSLAHDDDKVLG